jgi:hypothetical protein
LTFLTRDCLRTNRSGAVNASYVTNQHEEAIMTSGAIHNAVNRPVTPALIKVAGMAGDLYGRPDGRSALVLLNGLTYARDLAAGPQPSRPD